MPRSVRENQVRWATFGTEILDLQIHFVGPSPMINNLRLRLRRFAYFDNVLTAKGPGELFCLCIVECLHIGLPSTLPPLILCTGALQI